MTKVQSLNFKQLISFSDSKCMYQSKISATSDYKNNIASPTE